jgi:hypothetical protein
MPTQKPTPEAIAGFASLPHSLCADLDLTDNAYRILGALMRFAHDQTSCFPSNAKLGAAAGGKSPGTVVRGLRELEDRGLIRRVINPDSQHRDGIELTWDRIATPSISDGGPPPNLDRTPSKNGVPPSKFDMAPPPNLEGLYEEESGEESSSSTGERGVRVIDSKNGGGVAAEYPRTVEAAQALAEEFFPDLYVGQKIAGFVKGYGLEWVTDALFCAHASAKEPRYAAGYMNQILMGWRKAGGPPASEVAEARATVLRIRDAPRPASERAWMNKGDVRRQKESEELDQLGQQLREAR